MQGTFLWKDGEWCDRAGLGAGGQGVGEGMEGEERSGQGTLSEEENLG